MTCQSFARDNENGYGRECQGVIPCRNLNTPDKDLVYKYLLTNTFTQTGHKMREDLHRNLGP